MCCSVLQCVAVHTYTQDSDTLDCRLPVFLLSCMAPQIMGRRTGGYSKDTPPYMQTFRQRCVAVCCSVLNTLHTHKYTPPYTQTFRQRHCILTPQMMRAKENSLHTLKGQQPAHTPRTRAHIHLSICRDLKIQTLHLDVYLRVFACFHFHSLQHKKFIVIFFRDSVLEKNIDVLFRNSVLVLFLMFSVFICTSVSICTHIGFAPHNFRGHRPHGGISQKYPNVWKDEIM